MVVAAAKQTSVEGARRSLEQRGADPLTSLSYFLDRGEPCVASGIIIMAPGVPEGDPVIVNPSLYADVASVADIPTAVPVPQETVGSQSDLSPEDVSVISPEDVNSVVSLDGEMIGTKVVVKTLAADFIEVNTPAPDFIEDEEARPDTE